MTEPLPRYPRTPHLPGSPGATADDVWCVWPRFVPEPGRELVTTMKMDGANTTLHAGGMYGHSPSGRSRPWQSRMRAFAGAVCPSIPPGVRVCGEDLTVPHSIAYERDLPPFMVFSVWEGEDCLSWDETAAWADMLGLPTVPVLARGPRPADARLLPGAFESRTDTELDEGFVVRDGQGFARAEFTDRVAKWVRAGHVRTGDRWTTDNS
ncbi:RNA ligase family protein [Streptomyces sp. NBC_01433]|uniref:RNA ligase family protein n=1 Tax=Streptomyces sp. NBC_01433 TaxID=2903864 RepID=UPI002258F5EB|nr:RNA ligase family protein [Streptomyces sp. NBC_01433]MCX4682098.1 RNA ligase family protein [Streptomyces sp. NBC_01433]